MTTGAGVKGVAERLRAFDLAHPRVWDVTLVLLVLAACVLASRGVDALGTPFLVVACGAVGLRRRAPARALGVATVALSAGAVVAVLAGASPPWGHLAIWILVFNLTLRRSGARALVISLAGIVSPVVVGIVIVAVVDVDALRHVVTAATPVVTTGGVALLAGSLLRASVIAQQQQQDATARAAVAAERSRISREMHDLIGHDLAVIASLSAGGRNVVRSSPDDAERAFAAIGEVSRASVGQLRHVLRLLRAPEDGPPLALPLSQLGSLIDAVRDAGLRIEDERRGDLDALPSGHQLAVHRIVQEALTNTLRHAGRGTGVTVRIVADASSVVVSVVDRGATAGAPRPSRGDGHGILGMRERAEALGGTLEAGPTIAGWSVLATIPVGRA